MSNFQEFRQAVIDYVYNPRSDYNPNPNYWEDVADVKEWSWYICEENYIIMTSLINMLKPHKEYLECNAAPDYLQVSIRRIGMELNADSGLNQMKAIYGLMERFHPDYEYWMSVEVRLAWDGVGEWVE